MCVQCICRGTPLLVVITQCLHMKCSWQDRLYFWLWNSRNWFSWTSCSFVISWGGGDPPSNVPFLLFTIPQLCQLLPFLICSLFFCHHCQYLCSLVSTAFSILSWSTCCCSNVKDWHLFIGTQFLYSQPFSQKTQLWRLRLLSHLSHYQSPLATTCKCLKTHSREKSKKWRYIYGNGDFRVTSLSNHLSPHASVPLLPFGTF